MNSGYESADSSDYSDSEENMLFRLLNEEKMLQKQIEKQELKGTYVSEKDRRTSPYLTKYEKTRIIGTRAEQIKYGSPLCYGHSCEYDPYKIAEYELQLRKIPFIVKRQINPIKKIELWKLSELSFDRISFDTPIEVSEINYKDFKRDHIKEVRKNREKSENKLMLKEEPLSGSRTDTEYNWVKSE
ncbi:unnamed protein product [Moneuplotes crassus]|uniref:Uncharacterized protein n=1 Tax=Euplotes crassus TaxID=5936 RepID=A0AAD1XX59_EUPCR|nr:unnamed protein product [Moneuplotes crassus]